MKKTFFAMTSLIALGSTLALAAPVTQNFDGSDSNGSFGNSRTFGIITATAWSRTGTSGALATAALGRYSGAGLGVCNSVENGGTGSPSCSDPNHKVDNRPSSNDADDFVLLVFNQAVNISQIDLRSIGTGYEASIWTTNNLLNSNLAGMDLTSNSSRAAKGFTTAVNNPAEADPINISLNNVTAILIGARLYPSGDTRQNDEFKLWSVTYDLASNDPTVPEPATYAMMGAALLTLGMLRRRA